MAYRNTFFRWLFLYSLTFGLTYVLKLFTYLCPETGHKKEGKPGRPGHITRSLMASRAGARNFCDSESQKLPRFSFFFTLLQLTTEPTLPNPPISVFSGGRRSMRCTARGFRGREFSGETESF